MNAKLLLCLAALPAAVDALGEFNAPEEVKTTCPTLVPLRLNQTNTAGSLMNTEHGAGHRWPGRDACCARRVGPAV